MLVTQLFWLSFALPGYALIVRAGLVPKDGGLLSVVALAYAASFALLAPVSLLGYGLSLPIWVLSAACVLALLASVAWLVRSHQLQGLWQLLRDEPKLPLLLLVLLLVLQARVGGHLAGDAYFHVGRIRRLLEHGFENRDIYLAQPYFMRSYHTNLLHALYATLAQLTGQSYLDAWYCSQAWAKLLVAAGHYSLAYSLSQRRSAGWLLALCIITVDAGEDYTLYPNTLAVGWLLPILVGIGVRAIAAPHSEPRAPWLLAIGSALLGQVHAMYAVYLGLALALPLMAAMLLQPRASRPALAGCLFALLMALPFLLVSQYAHSAERGSHAPLVAAQDSEGDSEADDDTPAERDVADKLQPARREDPVIEQRTAQRAAQRIASRYAHGGGHLEKQLIPVGTGQWVFPAIQMGGNGFVVLGWLSLLVLAITSRDRSQRSAWLCVLASAASLSLVLFVPALCTLASRLLAAGFLVARLSTVLTTLLFAGLAGLVATLCERGPRPALAMAFATCVAVAVATQLAGHAPRSFADHMARALAPERTRLAQLRSQHALRRLLAARVPSASVLLARPKLARQLVSVCDCYVIVADRGHTQIPGIAQRLRDVQAAIDPRTPWPTRSAVFARYGVQRVAYLERERRRYGFLRGRATELGSAGGVALMALAAPR